MGFADDPSGVIPGLVSPSVKESNHLDPMLGYSVLPLASDFHAQSRGYH